jgi:hypothetical protein
MIISSVRQKLIQMARPESPENFRTLPNLERILADFSSSIRVNRLLPTKL